MKLYIFIELLILLVILIGKFFINESILNIIKFIPILINLIVVINKKSYLKICIFFTLIADLFFLIIDNHSIGISIFILVQVLYYLYLKDNKLLLNISFINILVVLILQNKILMIESIIYGLIQLINIYNYHKESKINKKLNILKYSLILLFLCDLSILFKSIIKINIFNITLDIVEWLFYIISQMIVTIYIIKSNK